MGLTIRLTAVPQDVLAARACAEMGISFVLEESTRYEVQSTQVHVGFVLHSSPFAAKV